MQKFLNPSNIVAQAGVSSGQTVADFGCGSGYYTLPAAQIVGSNGRVYACDIMADKLAVAQSTAMHNGCKNVTVIQTDLEKPVKDIAEGSCDVVIISNILHLAKDRDAIIRNAYAVLKTGGKLVAVEWKKEKTPLGPPLEDRISAEDLIKVLNNLGFVKDREVGADSFHYCLVFVK